MNRKIPMPPLDRAKSVNEYTEIRYLLVLSWNTAKIANYICSDLAEHVYRNFSYHKTSAAIFSRYGGLNAGPA